MEEEKNFGCGEPFSAGTKQTGGCVQEQQSNSDGANGQFEDAAPEDQYTCGGKCRICPFPGAKCHIERA